MNSPKSGISIGWRPGNHAGIMGCTEMPWLVMESIDFIFERINKESTVFEYGSGSSTFWFSKLVSKVYSVDHDPNWFSQMNNLMSSQKISNVDLRLSSCEMRYVLDHDSEVEEQYENYSKMISNLEVKEFDVILVDGVTRSMCIKESISHLKKGGMLVIDNAERPAYFKAIESVPSSWKRYEFSCAVDTTLIFIKE